MADRDLLPALPGLPALELRLIRLEKRPRFGALLCAQHYLRNATLVDATLRYVGVAPDGGWLALLGWSSAALHLRARDRWIGWSEPQRAARLRLIAQNSRFLILAERAHYPNLASLLLARCTRRLADDWRAAHGHTVVLAESFVDPALFEGTCYKAAGWLALGATGGFARDHRDFYVDLQHPKQLWVRALGAQACARLRAESLPAHIAGQVPVRERRAPVGEGGGSLPAHLAGQVPEPPPRCPYKSARLGSLWQSFHDQLTDPRARRGRRLLLSTILTIAAAGTVVGERGPKGIAKFAENLGQPQRRHLRCLPCKKTGRLIVPGEPTFRRAFKQLDRAQFHDLLAGWLAEHDPEKLTALAVDGKTVKGSRQSDGRPVHLMSAVAHRTQRLLNQIPVAEKSNEIPCLSPVARPPATGRSARHRRCRALPARSRAVPGL